MLIKAENVRLKDIEEPFWGVPNKQIELPDEVYAERLERTIDSMKSRELDYILIYADREHYGNFRYLTGFEPRFEEAILVLEKSGKAYGLLGNECIGMANYSRIPTEGILYHTMSLPNQPMGENKTLEEILREIGVNDTHKVGLVGWKLIYPVYGTKQTFDVPGLVVDGVLGVTAKDNVENATDLFIHPEYGTRVINNVDEIAYFEFGATYASDAVQQQLLDTRTGLTEVEISQSNTAGSLPTTCFPKVLSGKRIEASMLSPTTRKIELGDRYQVTVGLIGGQSNRKGFVAYSEEDLPEGAEDWLEKYVKPYFAVAANWYEMIGSDVTGGEIYDMVESSYPKSEHGWFLNPGHLIDYEEWMSSPIYDNSDIKIKSGMMFQMDIIPFVEAPYVAPDFEDGLVIADEALRNELKEKYPDVYERMQKRRQFMIDVLGIQLKPEVLPLSNISGLFRPYMLNKDKALVVDR